MSNDFNPHFTIIFKKVKCHNVHIRYVTKLQGNVPGLSKIEPSSTNWRAHTSHQMSDAPM